jgi:hypothetical protein
MIVLHSLPAWMVYGILVFLIVGMICRGISAVWEERQREKYWRKKFAEWDRQAMANRRSTDPAG